MNETTEKYFCPPELYDVMYADFNADIAYQIACGRSARGPMLEACCGNGRLLIPTLEAGVQCDGFDLDAAMLADLERKLAGRGLKTGVYRADMRDFTLPRRYALITIPFNSFGHNLTQEDQLSTLRCCREHLDEGGRLMMVFFHPHTGRLLSFDGTPKLSKEFPNPAAPGVVRVIDATVSDRVEQINSVTRRVEVVDAAGAITSADEVKFRIRYVWKHEMELLLKVAGFKRWEARPTGNRYNEPFEMNSDRPIEEGDILAWSAWKD